MLIKTKHSVSEIRSKIIDQQNFGTPIHIEDIQGGSRLYVMEQWTLRNANYMTVTILIEEKEEYRLIHYVVSGTSRAIFGFDWGASSSREKKLLSLLETHNFQYQILEQ